MPYGLLLVPSLMIWRHPPGQLPWGARPRRRQCQTRRRAATSMCRIARLLLNLIRSAYRPRPDTAYTSGTLEVQWGCRSRCDLCIGHVLLMRSERRPGKSSRPGYRLFVDGACRGGGDSSGGMAVITSRCLANQHVYTELVLCFKYFAGV